MKFYIQEELTIKHFIQQEIQDYVFKLFKLEVEWTLQSEDANFTLAVVPDEIKNDSISLRLKQGLGYIQSNSEVGLLIGVYRFFECFGVKFLRPGKKHEIIPDLSEKSWREASVQLDETASLKHRGVCIEGANSLENVIDFIDWLPKIGMNSFFIQFENPYPFLKRWYEHENNPYLGQKSFDLNLAQEMSDQIDAEMMRRGIVHHRVGHGWISDVLGSSSKFGWESAIDIAEDKKPLLAQLNGERELFLSAPLLTSLDFAKPEANDLFAEEVVNYAKKRSDVDILHVWLSDARNNLCECETCQKELISDQYVRLLNRIDDKLTQEGIQTKICFLLYHELLFAPEKETLNNPDRFVMMFAPISRTFEKSYADINYQDDIPEVPSYHRNKIKLPNSLEENLAYLFEWQKTFKGDSFVYDYPLGRAHYGDLGYMNISKIIHQDIQYLSNLELDGYMSCQELRSGFPHYFPNYVMGKMLWNSKQSYNTLKEEYFESLYGPEGLQVALYFEALSANSSCDYFNGIGLRLNLDLSEKYQAAYQIANDFLPAIVTKLSSNNQLRSVQKSQWIQLSYHREYTKKLSLALSNLSSGNEVETHESWHDFLDYIRRSENQIQSHLDVYRVIEVGTNYAGFKF